MIINRNSVQLILPEYWGIKIFRMQVVLETSLRPTAAKEFLEKKVDQGPGTSRLVARSRSVRLFRLS
jgi:hypothetical protein